MGAATDDVIRYVRRSLVATGVTLLGVAVLIEAYFLYLSTQPGLGQCQAIGQTCSVTSPTPDALFWILVAISLGFIVAGLWGLINLRRTYRRSTIERSAVV